MIPIRWCRKTRRRGWRRRINRRSHRCNWTCIFSCGRRRCRWRCHCSRILVPHGPVRHTSETIRVIENSRVYTEFSESIENNRTEGGKTTILIQPVPQCVKKFINTPCRNTFVVRVEQRPHDDTENPRLRVHINHLLTECEETFLDVVRSAAHDVGTRGGKFSLTLVYCSLCT